MYDEESFTETHRNLNEQDRSTMMVLLSTDTQLLSAGMEKNKTVAEETYC